MERSKRISFLSELTKGYDEVLDIGSDHGLVLLEAFKKGYIKRATASDLREKPLKKAKQNLKGYKVNYILSNGFEEIKKSFDLTIIAGMGPRLIGEILQKAPLGTQTYILQANDKIEILRLFLANNRFKIVDEYLVKDKFYYIVLKVCRGEMTLLEEDVYLGPILKKKLESRDYYETKALQIEKIMKNVTKERYEELKKKYLIYKRV